MDVSVYPSFERTQIFEIHFRVFYSVLGGYFHVFKVEITLFSISLDRNYGQ